MSSAELEWCTNYYCSGDCGLRGSGSQHYRPKTTAQRVEKLRQNRAALGIKRRELYLTDAQWAKVQAYVDKLTSQAR